jgi:hypothetical protein
VIVGIFDNNSKSCRFNEAFFPADQVRFFETDEALSPSEAGPAPGMSPPSACPISLEGIGNY